MRELWMLRHGQTDLNVAGVYFGTMDPPLNQTGFAQARHLAGRLTGPFDLVLSSPLLRALQTVETAFPGIMAAPERALAERDFGEWEGLSAAQMKENQPALWHSWQEDWMHFTPPGGESFLDMWQRTASLLDHVLARKDWTRCLLISHAGPIRCLLAHGLQLPEESSWRFAPEHARLSCLRFNREGYGWLAALNTDRVD